MGLKWLSTVLKSSTRLGDPDVPGLLMVSHRGSQITANLVVYHLIASSLQSLVFSVFQQDSTLTHPTYSA